MRVLDLFCGLKGWSQAFEDRKHEVITVDIEQRFNPTICADIMDLSARDFDKYGKFDVILASPPCEKFSVSAISRHWNKDRTPKDEETQKAIDLVMHTLKLIEELNPTWWVMENPRGMLRTIIKPTWTIAQCKYGKSVMKPTDLWGKLPSSFVPKMCENGNSDHDRQPRGYSNKKRLNVLKLGTQGMKNAETRAQIPYGLSLEICKLLENGI